MLVIVPFYNCQDWIEKSLRSIHAQHGAKRVVLMDDASTDESGNIAKALAHDFGFFYRRSDENKKCPYTIYKAMQEFGKVDPEEPVFIVDGDDWLPHDDVLVLVNEVYKDPDVWLTYGGYRCDPSVPVYEPADMFPIQTVRDRSYRSMRQRNVFNHPLTFRCWLFNSIPDSCFLKPDGEWFISCYDQVIMYPMLEMSTELNGHIHYRYLPDWLYTYNTSNPNSEVATVVRGGENLLSSYPVIPPARHP